jgi:hypothetical protein
MVLYPLTDSVSHYLAFLEGQRFPRWVENAYSLILLVAYVWIAIVLYEKKGTTPTPEKE